MSPRKEMGRYGKIGYHEVLVFSWQIVQVLNIFRAMGYECWNSCARV